MLVLRVLLYFVNTFKIVVKLTTMKKLLVHYIIVIIPSYILLCKQLLNNNCYKNCHNF